GVLAARVHGEGEEGVDGVAELTVGQTHGARGHTKRGGRAGGGRRDRGGGASGVAGGGGPGGAGAAGGARVAARGRRGAGGLGTRGGSVSPEGGRLDDVASTGGAER